MLGPDATANLAIRSTRSAVSPRSSAPAGTTADSRSSETTPHHTDTQTFWMLLYTMAQCSSKAKTSLSSGLPAPFPLAIPCTVTRLCLGQRDGSNAKVHDG